ncbi:HD-GYP domain-containing protein (c-di-GMP phosphodiesterase class II) [Cytobacillus purgationiresistens]|uniref:HD-GYP domain-containing protein (C-di-GMP phosphodiesterase class II) n=1 Tax=Cytobacillus purgationiresistens TaxID=863449 RepID=A0ABU0AM50_9BACI|nr:HD-GYP domain-containing protein (c-di-GMP phosphodiesterase class II) [Cytobacillus purgationiresistens]
MAMINEESFIETVYMKGLQISLVASGDGTEVIYHRLEPETMWGIEPEEGWDSLEFLHILSGELTLPYEGESFKAGDSFHKHPITEHYIFKSIGETEFLYVTSQPVFHYYSKATKELMDLSVAIEEKDGYTVDHCQRINKLSMMVGEEMGLEKKRLKSLNIASFLHDVGKLKIPLEILQKPGKLTSDEWMIMKQHSRYGRELLENIGLPFLKEAGKVVEQHHERYDGKGYPYGLEGDNILTEAAIISVVDSYDAMTSNRIYQKARAKEVAFNEILRCRGTMYNPQVVDVFLALKNKIIL